MEIIINTNEEWDSPPRSKHQIAYALWEKGIKVTYIAGNNFGFPGYKTQKIHPGFSVIQPSFPISRRFRYRTPILNEVYQIWFYNLLQKVFKDRPVILITSDFGGYLLPHFFSKVVYFASDDYLNNVNVPFFMKEYNRFTQMKLIKSVRFTISTAISLVNSFKEYNPKSFEMPLGAPTFKMNFLEDEIFRPRDGKIKVVLLGYIGKFKTPVELINMILENKKIEIHLIGPLLDDIMQEFNSTSNIILHGIKTGDELQSLLITMDVGIAPYHLKDPNTARTPNKLWQYLSAGKPAVITNLPNVAHWEFPENVVFKANSYHEFVEMITKAYDNDSVALVQKRIEIAHANSWANRADLLLDLVHDEILQKV